MNSGRKRIRRSATPGWGHQAENQEQKKPFRSDSKSNSEDRSQDLNFRKFDVDHDRSKERSFNRDDRPFNRDRNERSGDRPFNREDRPFNRDRNERSGDRPFNREDRPFNRDRNERSGDRPFNREDRPFNRDRNERSGDRPFNREDRPFNRDRNERSGDRPFNREDRPFNRDRNERSGDRPFNREDRPFNRERNERSGDRPFNREDRPFNRERNERTGDRPFNREDRPFNRDRNERTGDRPFNREDRPFNRERNERSGDRPFNREDRPFNRDRNDRSGDRPFNREDRPFNRDRNDRGDQSFNREPRGRSFDRNERGFNGRQKLTPEQEEARQQRRKQKREEHFNPFESRGNRDENGTASFEDFGKSRFTKGDHQLMRFEMKGPTPKEISFAPKDEWPIRLNRYLANAGIASRRDCDQFIQDGRVKVNDVVISELGVKVNQTDVVLFDDEPVSREKLVYVLLNKPKNFITTTDDPEGRKTVMDLVSKASAERLFPVGRLDRNTTGLLLLTNDGGLAQKLMHPSFEAEKVYHVILNEPLTKNHLIEISEGLNLEDGKVEVDEIAYVKPDDKREIGVEIHTGKNRIVRRIFESLGYTVEKLDRVVYASLTKLDLPRGHWRYLTSDEVRRLKRLSK